MGTYLGIELGSTRIKAVIIDEKFRVISSGDYTWSASFSDGIWTYDLREALVGLKTALSKLEGRETVCSVGVSGMMHGYLAFDENWNLLVPFRTWQNTITGPAAQELTELVDYNIPQRWTVAHLYQAILNGEAHVESIAHVTTLAGYIHYLLTGVNAVGIGEASGIFPVDGTDYREEMIQKTQALLESKGFHKNLRDVLPAVKVAGQYAGSLTEDGHRRIDGLLPLGVDFVPPEGDAGTGMIATNAVAPRTGNVSAGTSIFSMVVLEKPLSRVYRELSMVTTPAGREVAMVHGSNCTNDSNAWVSVLKEAACLLGADPENADVYRKLYEKSLEGEPDCGGVFVCNYLAGEMVTHFDAGRPLVIRRPDSQFTLANFFRATLYSTMVTLKIGMEFLKQEQVRIDSLTGHGGLFKTPVVGQKYLAAACEAPVTCMETAGEGGPYGMALLAAFGKLAPAGELLEDFLNGRVFSGVRGVTVEPDPVDVAGFRRYMEGYRAVLETERTAVQTL